MAERKRNTPENAARKAPRRSRRTYSRTLRRVPCTITLEYSISSSPSDKDTRKYIMEGELTDSTKELAVEYQGFPFLGILYPEKCSVKMPKNNRGSVVITGLDERLIPLGLGTFICEEGESIATYDLRKDSLISAVGFPGEYTVRTEKLTNTVTMLGGDIDAKFFVTPSSFGTLTVEYHLNVAPHNGYRSNSEI